MNILEKWFIGLQHIRHSILLEKQEWLWGILRPCFYGMLNLFYRKGLIFQNGIEHVINGTDRIAFLPTKFLYINETYEPEVWKYLMAQIKPDDVIADVGAHIGLYTVAMARRLGPSGKVVALEPEPENFEILKIHVNLNSVSNCIELIQAAASSQDGFVDFKVGNGTEAGISHVANSRMRAVRAVCLDTIFADMSLDLLKIDVEGYEEKVLLGAKNLLKRDRGSPRAIFIEVHPYAWKEFGTTSEKIFSLLRNAGYGIKTVSGNPVRFVEHHGEIVALKG